MKLYSTVTSERASKGQGGNELDIIVYDENRDELFKINVFKDRDDWYKVYFKSAERDGAEFQELLREVKPKGKKQKDNTKTIRCNNCMTYYKEDELVKVRECVHVPTILSVRNNY